MHKLTLKEDVAELMSTMLTYKNRMILGELKYKSLSQSENKNTRVKLDEVFVAYSTATQRKTNKTSVKEFRKDVYENLFRLYYELNTGTYTIGKTIFFVVMHPKPREVWAADFRDRIVHHIIYNKLAPVWNQQFSTGTYACIPKRGTLAAITSLHETIQHYQKQNKPLYYCQYDLTNFFGSINKQSLLEKLQQHRSYYSNFWDLIEQVVEHNPISNYDYRGNPNNREQVVPAKRLENAPPGQGLPIGNLTSQLFANVILNDFDHTISSLNGVVGYFRYVDDFVILTTTLKGSDQLDQIVVNELSKVKLAVNPTKTKKNAVKNGIDFVGQIVYEDHRVLRRSTFTNFKKFLRHSLNIKQFSDPQHLIDFMQKVNSYLSLMRHSDSRRKRLEVKRMLADYGFLTDPEVSRLLKIKEYPKLKLHTQ